MRCSTTPRKRCAGPVRAPEVAEEASDIVIAIAAGRARGGRVCARRDGTEGEPRPGRRPPSRARRMARYGDRRRARRSRRAPRPRLPAGRPRGIGQQSRRGTGGLVFHPRVRNGSLTDVDLWRPPPRSQANTWSSSPPGGGREWRAPPRRASLPATRYDVAPVPVARARPFSSQAFFSSVTVTRTIFTRKFAEARRGDARRDRRRRKKTPVPPRGLITNRAIERGRRIRTSRPVIPRSRVGTARGGAPSVPPGAEPLPDPATGADRPADWKENLKKKFTPSPPPR